MSFQNDGKEIAKTVLEALLKNQPGIDKAGARKELDDLIARNQATLQSLPSTFISALVGTFGADKFDAAQYAKNLGMMTDEELLTEIQGTAGKVKELRARVEARNALMADLRDTAFSVARRALVTAILAAV